MTKTIDIQMTDQAKGHFSNLLEAEAPQTSLRIYVVNLGKPSAEIGLSYCPKGEEKRSDISIEFGPIILFVDITSKEALSQAVIDYKTSETGGALSIKAPNLKPEVPAADAPLAKQLEFVIKNEINPSLASHGGYVTLVDVNEGVVSLRFGGGCQGCGMANVTLKHGIEKSLKEKFPQVVEIKDVTPHAEGANPYY